jgi:hypothetical protein
VCCDTNKFYCVAKTVKVILFKLSKFPSKLSKFFFPNCQNFPFQTVKILIFKTVKFSFQNCQNFPFSNCQNFPFQTVKISHFQTVNFFLKLSKFWFSVSRLKKFEKHWIKITTTINTPNNKKQIPRIRIKIRAGGKRQLILMSGFKFTYNIAICVVQLIFRQSNFFLSIWSKPRCSARTKIMTDEEKDQANYCDNGQCNDYRIHDYFQLVLYHIAQILGI